MKNAITNIINRIPSKYSTGKTFNSNVSKIVPNSFTPQTKRAAFLANAVLLLFLSLFLTSGEVRAASYTVNLNTDVTDANVGNGVCDTNAATPGDQCTLRAALQEANALAGIDFISFSLPTPNVINLANGELNIYDSVSIDGPGARGLTIQRDSSAGSSRIFAVSGSNISAAISGVTIANGNTPNFFQDVCGNNGGGICLKTGTLTLTAVNISNNTSNNGYGGGIYNDSGALNIRRSTVATNQSSGAGGGIYNSSGTANISNSTVSNNTASGGAPAGGIYNNTGGTSLTNVTVSNNAAGGAGGGVVNSSGSSNLRNTIVAGNTSGNGTDVFGAFTSQGNNLIGISAGNNGFTNGANGDKIGTFAAPINAMLGALQNNGGQTDTRALLAGSPAIDAGNNCVADPVPVSCLNDPLTTDQRGAGFARKLDGDSNGTATVDIGAFEAVLIPTAAGAVAGGRILTISGKGIRNVKIIVTLQNGATLETVSGESGFYQFANLQAGETYIFSVSAKHYGFSQSTQVRSITEDVADIDFVADVSLKKIKFLQ